MLLRCLISFLKRIRDVSGSRPETGFPRMSGCNKRRRKNKRCHLAPATVFRKDFGSHQEGLIFFLIQNQKKENFCSIFVKKNILLLNNFCIKEIVIKIKYLLNLDYHLLSTYYTPANLNVLHTGSC